MRRDESAAPKSNSPQQSAEQGTQSQKGSENQKGSESEKGNAYQKGKDDKKSNSLLAELLGPNGLGSIKGNTQHGVGLLPVRSSPCQRNKTR